MQLSAIIAELEGAARQEAASVHILETTHWEREAPDLLAGSLACLEAAKRRADAFTAALRLLRNPIVAELPGLVPEGGAR